MPLTVITMKKVPPSLKGDLSKWMQEISTGVYVGNFNSKVRSELWKRVKENMKDGEASLTYQTRNEIGYSFETINSSRQVVDFDGIPLVYIGQDLQDNKKMKRGFSKASKYRKAQKYSQKQTTYKAKNLVILDIETNGLDPYKDEIIEIGAVKITENSEEYFQSLIKINQPLKENISKLTGIKQEDLDFNGQALEDVLEDLRDFIQDSVLVGYNIKFDIGFLNQNLKEKNMPTIRAKQYDLLDYIKGQNLQTRDYKLETVAKSYKIEEKASHRALDDAIMTYRIARKVNGFLEKIKTNS